MAPVWKSRWFACLALIVLGVGVAVSFVARRPSVEALVEQAKQARAAKDLIVARRYARAALAQDRESAAAWRLLGQIETDEGHPDEAIEAFEAASRQTGIDAVAAALHGGRISLQAGHALRAERLWRRVLELDSTQADASSELAYLLGVEGRGWEMQSPLLIVVRAGRPTVHHLVLMAASEPVVKDADLVRRCLTRVPSDLNVRTGEARTDLFEGRTAQALSVLREICRSSMAIAEAKARLGWALLELHPDEFSDWQQSLETFPQREHPEIWAVQGTWAVRNKDLPQAARCFARAVQLDPDHRMANYQLGSVLSQLDRSPEAQPFLDRAAKLQQLALLADRIYAHPRETFQLRQATELTAALGRPHEAWGWCHAALQINPHLEWANKNAEKLQPWLTSTAPRVIPEALPVIPPDLIEAMVPRGPIQSTGPLDKQQASEFAAPRFEDVAGSIGLDFIYDAGSRNRQDGVDLIEFTGGGVAAFDYDRDDLCDLYFTQGRAIPLTKVTAAPPDRLFRQSIDGGAADVTVPAGLGDVDYSQGCTVGDFDQDGFPDLYVCNVGPNRLYRNNGDGTFDDVTQHAGISGNAWTVSALFADLNGDGLPELFDVNYLDIDPHDIPHCPRGSEDTHCAPTARPPAPDRLWLNRGDGGFVDISQQAGLTGERETGRGLGIVAADLNGDARLDLFIANDAEPNFLYVNRLPPNTQPSPNAPAIGRNGNQTDESPATSTFPALRLEELGVVMGVGYDRDGLAQACMGVALGDADQNGLLDIFVTNYADQSNTLFRQVEPGLFQDATREAGLREPSFALLGFGTQFLDADLDGRLDLILTNGHVYDMTYAGKLYAMRPQFFRNAGHGRFVESFRETAGDFFGISQVGRGLARLDWNRDGLSDIAISHIGTPAALLLNRTQRTGNHLSLTFAGTVSERDAIGTVVRVFTADGLHSTHHLTAGDGYQARNEPRLIVGLGSKTDGIRLELQWPSGRRQMFDSLTVNRRYHLIEGGRSVTMP